MADKIDGRTRQARSKRTKRVPFGTMRLKLDLDAATAAKLKAENKVPYWVLDKDNGANVQAALDGGYEFVESTGGMEVGGEEVKEDRRIKVASGDRFLYLMAIPKEYYDEDQAEKEATNRMVDDSIRAGRPKGVNSLDISADKGGVSVGDVKYNP